jgi:hypothetical protein
MAATARVNTSGFLSFAEADHIKALIGRIVQETGTRELALARRQRLLAPMISFFFVRRGPGGWGQSVIIA